MEENPHERRSAQELRDRVIRTESDVANLKTNIEVMAKEFRSDIEALSKTVDKMRDQLVKVIIIVTLLSQAAGDLAPTLIKSFVS